MVKGFPPRPSRFWVKKTGPGEVQRIVELERGAVVEERRGGRGTQVGVVAVLRRSLAASRPLRERRVGAVDQDVGHGPYPATPQ